MELKPCPFCGGEAELRAGKLYIYPVVKVRCMKCGASTDFVFIDHPACSPKDMKAKEETRYTEDEAKAVAIEAWNRRADNEPR